MQPQTFSPESPYNPQYAISIRVVTATSALGHKAPVRFQIPLDSRTYQVNRLLMAPFETVLYRVGVHGIAYNVSATCIAPDDAEKVEVTLMYADPFWMVARKYRREHALFLECHKPFVPEYPFVGFPVIALNVKEWTDEFGRKTPLRFSFEDSDHKFKVNGLSIPPYQTVLREVRQEAIAHQCQVCREQDGMVDLVVKLYYIDPFWLIAAKDAEPIMLAAQSGDYS